MLSGLSPLARDARAWPFEQARNLLQHLLKTRLDTDAERDLAASLIARGKPDEAVATFPALGRAVILETGYGPSGLPHMGTFGEVARTTMVRAAFRALTEDRLPTRLICFSDDMDGLRKAPENVPNREILIEDLGKPLTVVRDPFGEHPSFGQHNNARLKAFLDSFGFDYEFLSSTDCYRSGRFDAALLKALERFDEIQAVMLPTLGPERRATYSCFLPISPTTGRVLQVPTLERNLERGTIVFEDEDGSRVEAPVTGGAVKLQWKPDWAMRWAALGVDYEMAGKDLIELGEGLLQDLPHPGRRAAGGLQLRALPRSERREDLQVQGQRPDHGGVAEVRRAREPRLLHVPVAALGQEALFRRRAARDRRVPAAARRLPAPGAQAADREPGLARPHRRAARAGLARVLRPDAEPGVGGQRLGQGDPVGLPVALRAGRDAETEPLLDRLAGYAINYYEDFVRPNKRFRAPDARERAALEDLAERLRRFPADCRDGEAIQNEVYEVGKAAGFEPLRAWFQALYEVLLGQNQGPRFGSFVAIFGVERTLELVERALETTLPS